MRRQKKDKYFIRSGRTSVRFGIALAIICTILIGGKLFLDAVYVPAILMYHSTDIETPEAFKGTKLNVRPKTFEKQMKFLHEYNYKVIPLIELIEMVKKRKKISRKTLAITFDDGFKNNFLYAYPALKKYGFPATIFVPVEFVNGPGYLSWEDIRTMQENNISIGSHTISHKWLPSLDEGELRREIFDSKEILEKMTGREIKTISYPLGAFDERVTAIAKKAGYTGAVATNPGKGYPKNDPYAMKRIRISMTSDSLLTFWIETSGYYTFIKEWRDED